MSEETSSSLEGALSTETLEPRDDDPHNDDLPTPRASQYGATAAQTIADDHTEELTLNEDYFNPPLMSRAPITNPPSQLLSLQSLSEPGTPTGLQSKATTAISLPDGVYAQQQDGVGSASGSGSVTTAPSFSDSTSVRSFAPTISTTGERDVESMLGEILEEDEARFGGDFIEEVLDDEDDEDIVSDDEEGLSEGARSPCARARIMTKY
jgi:hypothetical protein